MVPICGSLQAESSNLVLLRAAQRLAATMPSEPVDFVIYDGLGHIPPFNPDVEAQGFPAAILDLKARLAESAAVFVACPEYVFGVPGTVKNMFDWLVGSTDIDKKPFAVSASVSHQARGSAALKSLTLTLEVMGAVIVGEGPIVRGPTEEQDLADRLSALVAAAAS